MATAVKTIRAVLVGGQRVLAGNAVHYGSVAGAAMVDALIASGSLKADEKGNVSCARFIAARGFCAFTPSRTYTRQEAEERAVSALVSGGLARKVQVPDETQAPAEPETKAPSTSTDDAKADTPARPAEAKAKPKPKKGKGK